MSLLRKKTQSTLSRFAENEKRKQSKKIGYFGTFIIYILCVVLLFYFYDLKFAILISVLTLFVVIPLELLGWYLTCRAQDKQLSRYMAFCTDAQYPTVLVISSDILLKAQRIQPHQMAMIFYEQSEEKVRRFATCLLHMQKKQLPHDEILRLQAEIESSQMMSTHSLFLGYAPVDLYDLQGKTILIARNVIEYYGEPDSARLAQNGCTFSVFDEYTENTQFSA